MVGWIYGARRARRALPLFAVMPMLLGAAPTAAQEVPTGRVVETSDGTVFVLKDGKKFQIQVLDQSDDDIGAMPDGTPVDRLDQFFAPTAPVFTFTTRSGPRTEQQLHDELASIGYGGPWDVSSMLLAFAQAGAPAPAPAAPAPAAPAPPKPTARIGAPIQGQGLNLRTRNLPEQSGANTVAATFSVENVSGSTLNFRVPFTAFHLDLSNGRSYPGNDSVFGQDGYVPFNDLRDRESRDFSVRFRLGWDDFQSLKLDKSVNWYAIAVDDFNSRLPSARWQEDILH